MRMDQGGQRSRRHHVSGLWRIVDMRRMTLAMSDRIDDELAAFARTNGVSKAEAIRRAVAVLALARQQRAKGRSLGIVEEDDDRKLRAVGRVVGV